MNTQINSIKRQRGVSLIEVLVTLVVIAVALLGSASLQVLSKRANHEAVQRTNASQLAFDFLERVRSNKSALEAYVPQANLGQGSQGTAAAVDCSADGADCTAAQIAAYDLWQWEQLLDGATVTDANNAVLGGLLNPTVCVTGPAGGFSGVFTVAITWRGVTEGVDPTINACGAASGLYGDNDEYRRVLTMQTFVDNG